MFNSNKASKQDSPHLAKMEDVLVKGLSDVDQKVAVLSGAALSEIIRK